MSIKRNIMYQTIIKIPIKKILCAFRGVKNGTNTFISPRAQIVIRGKITLGSDVVVEARSRLVAIKGGTIEIGDRGYIYPYALIKADNGKVVLGEDCSVHDYSVLYGRGDLIIGNSVRIATGVVIVPYNHIYLDSTTPIYCQGTTAKGVAIEDDVWIGARAIILDGVNIGKGSIIGAGAVVTKSILPFSVAVGNPAKVIKKRV
jgi:acetyltransferase-like isoleucine patch superfamily enzyme